MIGEYGPWDNDQGGAFTDRLFDWAEAHERVKMLLYYRGVDPDNAYNLQHYPGARRVIRRHLDQPRWVEFAPGVKQLDDPPPPERPQLPQAPARRPDGA